MTPDLEDRFDQRGIRRGGIRFLGAADAMDLIESARREQRPILGVETFLITDTTTEPLMDHILDLSAGSVPADTWSEARQFVAQRIDCGFMFEITV